MKYIVFFLIFFALANHGFSQNKEIYYTIKNPQTGETRIVSQTNITQEINNFKEIALQNGAFYDENRTFVIPLSKEKEEISELQRSLGKEMQTFSSGKKEGCSWREKWGDSTFGAEAYIEVNNTGTKDSFHYSTYSGIKGTIFSKDLKIIELSSHCSADPGVGEGNSADTNGTTKIILFGKVVFSRTNPKLEYKYQQNDLSMFQYSQLFWVGPVPITIDAKLTGSYGFDMIASACLGAAAGVVKTFGGMDINLLAHTGISGVLDLGVTAKVRLIYLEIRTKASIYLASFESYIIEGNVALDLKSLDARVYIFFEFLFEKYKREIFRWNGFENAWTLWSYKKEYPF